MYQRRYVLGVIRNIIDILCDILISLGPIGISLSLCPVESTRLSIYVDESLFLCN